MKTTNELSDELTAAYANLGTKIEGLNCAHLAHLGAQEMLAPPDKAPFILTQSNRPDPLEVAEYFKMLSAKGLTQTDIGKREGISQAAVCNFLRLLSLPQEIKESIHARRLSFAHAKALCGLQDYLEAQIYCARQAIAEGWSARHLEVEVARIKKLNARDTKE